MLTLFGQKKQSRILNILLLAMVCTVGAGMLLHAPNSGNNSTNEMSQYIVERQGVKTQPIGSFYNPFALASESANTSAWEPVKHNWVISDEELALNKADRDILNNLLKAKAMDETISQDEVNQVFSHLDGVRTAMESYFLRHKHWPKRLGDLAIKAHPSATLALSTRGRINASLPASDDNITLSPSFTQTPIKWYCQTSLENHLLGSGKERLCIHRKN